MALIGVGTAAEFSAAGKIQTQFGQEITAFFKNPTYRQKLIDGVSTSVHNLGDLIIDCIDTELKLGLKDEISANEKAKAKAIFNNINSSKIPEDMINKLSVNILEIDPYEPEYYTYFITKNLKNSKEIIAIANHLGVDITESLKKIVKKVAIANIGSTFDDFKSCKKLVNDVVSELGFPEESKRSAEQVIQERCVALLKNHIDQNISKSENEARNCKKYVDERVKEFSIFSYNSAPLYKLIDEKLNKYDLEYRTIMGVVFRSREYAETNRKAIEENQDILNKQPQDLIYRSDYIENMEKIKKNT